MIYRDDNLFELLLIQIGYFFVSYRIILTLKLRKIKIYFTYIFHSFINGNKAAETTLEVHV